METLNNYLNVLGCGSLGTLQPRFCREGVLQKSLFMYLSVGEKNTVPFSPKEGRPYWNLI